MQKSLFLDVTKLGITPHYARPIHDQDPMESCRLWEPVTAAIKKRDYNRATEEKIKVEEEQRLATQLRESEDLEWRPKFFHLGQSNFWQFVELDSLRKAPGTVRSHISESMAQHFGHL